MRRICPLFRQIRHREVHVPFRTLSRRREIAVHIVVKRVLHIPDRQFVLYMRCWKLASPKKAASTTNNSSLVA